MISIILTIHNKGYLVRKVLESLYLNCSFSTNELIIVLDGCSDNSEEVVKDFIRDEGESWLGSEHIKLIYTPDVFETKANNAGLKAVNPLNLYAVIIQDDCVIRESNFDARLLRPIRIFKDIWAVSGNNAHNICHYPHPPYCLDYPDVTGARTDKQDRNTFYIRQVVNRGPLAVNMNIIKDIGYFSENIWRQNGDDHLICLDVYKNYKLKCGSFIVNFESRLEWGSTRSIEASRWIEEAIWRNQTLILSKHSDLIDKEWNEERYLP